MFLRRLVWAASLLALAGSAWAADKPTFGPPPTWAAPSPAPAPPAADAGGGAAVEIQLLDMQLNFGPAGDAAYVHRVIRIGAASGLSAANLALGWNPETQDLILHHLLRIRDGKRVDLLADPSKLTVLRRETNLEAASLDGTLTASLQPEDVRVGDVLDFSMTLVDHDPVLGPHRENSADVTGQPTVDHLRMRATWSRDRPMRWKVGPGLPPAQVGAAADGTTTFLIDQSAYDPPAPPAQAPQRYQRPDAVAFSDFTDWSQAGALLAPLYDAAARAPPGSPLAAEIARIAAASADPKTRAAQALRLVEQDVRYLFVGMGLGGLRPASAELTWSRRYGDCKGKTALLLALLRGLGIEAAPALVNSRGGDSLPVSLPALRGFDHVIVRARIGGRIYWLDGTRLFDRDLDDLESPHFEWALLLDPAGARLVAIDDPPPPHPLADIERRIDLSAGPEAPAKVRITVRFRGDAGAFMNVELATMSPADRKRKLLGLTADYAPWIEPDAAQSQWDAASGVLTVSLSGQGKIPWTGDDSDRQFFLPDAEIGGEVALRREPGPDRDAPWVNAWPLWSESRTTILLPEGGRGYALEGGGDVDETVTGSFYHRRARLEGALVTLEVSQKSLTREFPFSESEATMAALRRLGEKSVWLSAPAAAANDPVAPATSPTPPAPAPSPPPVNAAGFAARGAARLSERRLDDALADLGRAIALDPKPAAPYYNRGLAHLLKGDRAAARADVDLALRRAPADWRALLLRARMGLQTGDAAADRDVEAAITAAGSDKAAALEMAADNYDRAGRFDAEVAVLGRLLATAIPDGTRVRALDSRCWARAEWNRDLDLALADCEAVLRTDPDSLSTLDSRALIALRRNRLDAAIADYDRVLAGRPNAASSLYGRGLAKLRKGDTAGGRAELEAATRVDAKTPARFKAIGLTP